MAVFLTTGIVSECQLVTPGYFGNTSTYLGRRICICPLHIEYQRAAAFIGNSLKHKVSYLGPLFNGIISFSTRKDTGSAGGIMSPTTPTRYPGSLGFNEKGTATQRH
jgi:hypothetical protein